MPGCTILPPLRQAHAHWQSMALHSLLQTPPWHSCVMRSAVNACAGQCASLALLVPLVQWGAPNTQPGHDRQWQSAGRRWPAASSRQQGRHQHQWQHNMAFPHAAGYGTDSPVWHHRQQQSGSEQDRSREQQGDEPAKQAKQRNGETASPAKTNGNGQPQSQGSVVAQLSDIVQTRSLLYRSNKVDWQVCSVQHLCCAARAVTLLNCCCVPGYAPKHSL